MFTINLHSRTGTGPKKIRDLVRSGCGPTRSRTNNRTGSNSTIKQTALHSAFYMHVSYHNTFFNRTNKTFLSSQSRNRIKSP